MARSDYGPGRRRKPMIAWMLDWAAGVLIGILALMVGAAGLSLVFEQGPARVEAFAKMGVFVWPVGAALGVWLSMGRPLRGRELGLGLAASGAAVALIFAPVLLGLDSLLARTGLGLLALLLAPGAARALMYAARQRA